MTEVERARLLARHHGRCGEPVGDGTRVCFLPIDHDGAHGGERANVEYARMLCATATPGPWELWTSNSMRRITGPDRVDGGVLSGTVSRHDGVPDLTGKNLDADLRFIIAARSLVPQLVDHIDRLHDVLHKILILTTLCSEDRQRIRDIVREEFGP